MKLKQDHEMCDTTDQRRSLAYVTLVQLLPVFYGMHSRGIVHCNIKPDNLMIGSEPLSSYESNHDSRISLINFGLVALTGPNKRGLAGTPLYYTPSGLSDNQTPISPAMDW